MTTMPIAPLLYPQPYPDSLMFSDITDCRVSTIRDGDEMPGAQMKMQIDTFNFGKCLGDFDPVSS